MIRVVVALLLLPSIDGTRVVAREILINTPAVANLIRENNVAQLASAIQTGAKSGMLTMEQSVRWLAKEKLISEETAANRVGRDKHL